MKTCRNIIRNAFPVFVPAVMLVFFICLSGCENGSPSVPGETVIQVNNSRITLEEFNNLLKFEVYADPEVNLTAENRAAFVDYLIQKELMIQEAARLKLDRKKEFVITIQKYWESTLIRHLLDLKTEEFKKRVLVTEDEVAEYYAENKDEFDIPLAGVKEDITRMLTDKKLSKKIGEWTDSLRQNADIRIDPRLTSQP